MRVFFLFLVWISLSLTLGADAKYGEFIDKQITMIHAMNDENITRETIIEITHQQEEEYSKMIDYILANKKRYLEEQKNHSAEIFALQKIIKLNKRYGNKYAVIRDEVLIKSYKVIDLQSDMIRSILIALDKYDYPEFQAKTSELFAQNQVQVSKINDKNYDDILQIQDGARVIKQAQKNIRDFYAILEINSDVIKYLSIFDKKMFSLNKYSQYKLIKPILFLNELKVIKYINPILAPLGFSVVKILIILILILFVYVVRKVFYNVVERYIITIKSLEKYSTEILNSIRKIVEIVIVIINVELVLYVYNDFVSIESVSKVFNMTYGFFFTLIIYRVANVIAMIKINEINLDGDSIKYEIINVGIKIINVTIWIIGLLIVLFLAGINLTAVLSGLGIGGFAIALAAKDSLANFFGTLSILFSDIFSQGDWIEVDGREGVVVEIGLRVTTLRTFDNALISIPNSTVTNKDVKNWNKRSLGRRIKMSIGVKYDSKPQDIKKALEDIYGMLEKHPGIATQNTEFKHKEIYKTRVIRSYDDEKGVKKTLLVYLDEFGDSSINILIYCFSKTVLWKEWLEVKQDVMFQIMEILEKNNLEFAFPSLSLYHENEAIKSLER